MSERLRVFLPSFKQALYDDGAPTAGPTKPFLAVLAVGVVMELGKLAQGPRERVLFELDQEVNIGRLWSTAAPGRDDDSRFMAFAAGLATLPSLSRWARDTEHVSLNNFFKAVVGYMTKAASHATASGRAQFQPDTLFFLARGAIQGIIQLACAGEVASRRCPNLIAGSNFSSALGALHPFLKKTSDQSAVRMLSGLVQATTPEDILAIAFGSPDPVNHVWLKCAADIHGVGGTCKRFEEGQELQACSRCMTQRYCSPAHQAADWPQHKPYCRKLRS